MEPPLRVSSSERVSSSDHTFVPISSATVNTLSETEAIARQILPSKRQYPEGTIRCSFEAQRYLEREEPSILTEEPSIRFTFDDATKKALEDFANSAITESPLDRTASWTRIERSIDENLSVETMVTQSLQEMSLFDFELLRPILAEESFFREGAIPETGVVAANILSRAGMAVATGIILNQVENVIKEKQELLKKMKGQVGQQANPQEQVDLKRDIARLTNWFSVQREAFNEQLKDHALSSALSAPKAGVAIARIVDKASVATTILGWVFVGTSLVGAAVQYRKAKQDVNTHEDWVKAIKPKVAEMLAKYNEDFKKKIEENEPLLVQLLQTAKGELLDSQQSVESIVNRLKEAGLEVPLGRPQREELDEWLSKVLQDRTKHIKFNEQMIRKREDEAEVVSTILCNSVRELCEKKEQIDRNFLKFNLMKAKGILGAACVVTALTIAFKVLSVVGVAVMGAAVVATGYGVLATLVGLMVVGAVYLYVKKPNLFKTYVEGAQARLFFHNIPLAIQKYRYHYAKLQTEKIAAKVEISIIDFPNQLRQRDKLYDKKDKLEKKMASLKQSIDTMENKIKPLQKRITEAGWKDFYQELQQVESGKEDIAGHLADHIHKQRGLLKDKRTVALLTHMGLKPQDLEQAEPLAQQMRTFFALDEGDTLKLIGRQNRMAEMEKRFLLEKPDRSRL